MLLLLSVIFNLTCNTTLQVTTSNLLGFQTAQKKKVYFLSIQTSSLSEDEVIQLQVCHLAVMLQNKFIPPYEAFLQ